MNDSRETNNLQEPMLNVRATQREIVAIELATAYFKRYCKELSPVYQEASELLEQFQRRAKGPQPLLVLH